MKSIEWALAFFLASVGISILTVNIIVLASAYKLLTKIERKAECHVVFDEEAERYIDQIKISDCELLS